MTYRYLIVLCLGAIIICSCKKTEENQISSIPQQIIETEKTSITNWAATKGINLQTNNQILTGAEAVANYTGMAVTNEIFLETGRAGAVLKQLHDQGLLPGISKDEHGNMTSDRFVFSNNANGIIFSNIGETITYPTTRTFHLVKYGETSTNNYTLAKQTKDNEWKLQKAWLTDSNGQIIQEWPVSPH